MKPSTVLRDIIGELNLEKVMKMSIEKVLVLGSSGMVGRALTRTANPNLQVVSATRNDADCRDFKSMYALYETVKPDVVIVAAATVGGIHANDSRPAEFIADNLAIAYATITAAHAASIPRLLFLGSSCIYPKQAPQPMPESSLLSGALELTNEPYAIAKIAGIKLCESFRRQFNCDFRSVMPTNLYGPHDRFDEQQGHVIPALMRRFHQAKINRLSSVKIWGSGEPRREFLHVDDLANACWHVVHLTETKYWSTVDPRCSHINIGFGDDIKISELAMTLRDVIGLQAQIEFDRSMPDGAPRKLLDCSKLNQLDWQAKINLRDGLKETYQWYLEHEVI